MDSKTFFKVRAELDALATKILDDKGIAYSQEAATNDRLGNFKRAAKAYGVSPLTVVGIFLNKHLDSIQTWVRDIEETGRITYTVGGEDIASRIADARNYLDLLYAAAQELQQEVLKSMEAKAPPPFVEATGSPGLDDPGRELGPCSRGGLVSHP